MGITGKIRDRLRQRWLARCSLDALAGRLARRRGVLGLCYHALAEGLEGYPYRTSPQAFDAQVAFLKRIFRIVTVADAVEMLRSGAVADEERPIAIICFDDGYRCNWTQATPVLERHEVPATLFAPHDLISQPGPTYLDERELVTLAQHRLWEVGGHGISHNVLTGLMREDYCREIAQSAEWLTNLLGPGPRGFAYPQGQFDGTIAEETRACFAYGLATDQRQAPGLDLYQIRRFCPMREHDDLHRFAQALCISPMEGGAGRAAAFGLPAEENAT